MANCMSDLQVPRLSIRGKSDENPRAKTMNLTLDHSILSTKEDLDRMKYGVGNQTDPWYTAYQNMSSDSLASSSYTMKGPLTYVTRNATGSSPGKSELSHDSVASLLNALRWYITGDTAYAEKSVEILNAWASTLELLNGTDAQLTAGLYGPQLVNAAEIMRYTYSGWTAGDIAVFEKMILDIFYPPASQTTPSDIQKYPFLANWGTGGEKAIVAFGVFLNNATMYNQGLDLYQSFACANLNNTINPFGQNSESGRDQAHVQLSLGNMAELCQTAYNQGDNYWDLLGSRLRVGYEYTASYNLGNTVDYDPDFYRCGADLVGGPWSNISDSKRGEFRSVYEIAYGYFVQVKGSEMPYTQQVIRKNKIEANDVANNMGDSASYGTLRFSRGDV
ncbi:chondroitin AC/alginate lyase [Aspergillus californicus]